MFFNKSHKLNLKRHLSGNVTKVIRELSNSHLFPLNLSENHKFSHDLFFEKDTHTLKLTLQKEC